MDTSSIVGRLQDGAQLASLRARAEIERFAGEIEFAEGLCALHKREARTWGDLIRRAGAIVEPAIAGGAPDALRAAVREAEALLAPIARVAKGYTVHLVAHAHIDMNWMWSWPETVAVTNDTFTTMLRLMEEYPDFRFSQSQASTYAIVEKYNPALLARIAARVAEGRWEVTASHWVEGDKNMAAGESLCRHLLYTRRYMQRLFGLAPEDVPVDWSPDTFGHPVTMPTYLARGGVKYYYLHRPGADGPARPGAFWWVGPDGSRILVRNDMALGYNGAVRLGLVPHSLKFYKETGARDYQFVYGVGDHGGGPTRRDIEVALDMATWPVFPTVAFSTVRAFFERLEAQGAGLPVIDYELNAECNGCYTTETLIKRANRFSESRLRDAETSAALAGRAAGLEVPRERLVDAWRSTLFSHFHDILPGSGVHDTRTYTHGLFQEIMAATSMTETQALRAFAGRIDTAAAAGMPAPQPERPVTFLASSVGAGVGFDGGEGALSRADQSRGNGAWPFVFFNSLGWDREEVVEVTVWDNCPWGVTKPLRERSFVARLDDGTTIAAQKGSRQGGYWGHDYQTLTFPVKVPALGFATVVVKETPEAMPATATASASAPATEGAALTSHGFHCGYMFYERSGEGIENEHLRVELDPATGGIRSLLDKRSGLEWIACGAGVSPANGGQAGGPHHNGGSAPMLEYVVERPHGMTAWLIDHAVAGPAFRATALKREEPGPYRAAIAVTLKAAESEFTLTYELRAGDPTLYMNVAGTWFERGTPATGIPVLRLALPLALRDPKMRYEVPLGTADRDLQGGEERPALEWVRVAGKAADGKPAACLLLNDSKHGHSIENGTLRLTLIRSSYDPDPLPEIGHHEARVAFVPLRRDPTVAEATEAARRLNHPLRIAGTDLHGGSIAARGQFVEAGPASVVVQCVKQAEEGEGLVVRLLETAGKRATARLRFDEALVGKVSEVVEVDLIERPVAKSTARVASGNSVTVTVQAYGLATVVVRARK
jgi:alpha-mannosidase